MIKIFRHRIMCSIKRAATYYVAAKRLEGLFAIKKIAIITLPVISFPRLFIPPIARAWIIPDT